MTVWTDLLHAGGVLQACCSQLMHSGRWISVQTLLRMRKGKNKVSFEDSINYGVLENWRDLVEIYAKLSSEYARVQRVSGKALELGLDNPSCLSYPPHAPIHINLRPSALGSCLGRLKKRQELNLGIRTLRWNKTNKEGIISKLLFNLLM